MNRITDGHKLFLTAHYAFKYNESYYTHLMQFDVLEQFFEHRNNMEGYISDEKGDYIRQYSEVDILMEDLYEGFGNKNIPEVVERYLHKFEMYEVLAEYHKPLSVEALIHKEELLNS